MWKSPFYYDVHSEVTCLVTKNSILKVTWLLASILSSSLEPEDPEMAKIFSPQREKESQVKGDI
jgi:hypothetical protein